MTPYRSLVTPCPLKTVSFSPFCLPPPAPPDTHHSLEPDYPHPSISLARGRREHPVLAGARTPLNRMLDGHPGWFPSRVIDHL